MSDARTRLVAEGYDRMSDKWEAFAHDVSEDPRLDWLQRLLALLPAGSDVVELGCGAGTRETQELARRHRVTAVDLSGEQLRKARGRVPTAGFVQADILELELAPASVDAVVSFYVFNHVPRERLAGLLGTIAGWLRPGGLLLAAFGTSDLESWEGEWLGVPMFFSSYAPQTNSRLVAEAGLAAIADEVVTIHERDGHVAFQWILARR
jgi:SAM-dependent methyltransferase